MLSRIYHFDIGDRNDHLAAPGSDVSHLRNDLVLQIPRQNKQVIRLGLVNRGHRKNWNVHSWRISAVFVRVAVDGEVKEICADSAVVEQCIPFAGGAVSAQSCASLLALNQEGKKLTLGVMHPFGKLFVPLNVLKANLAFVSKQCGDGG